MSEINPIPLTDKQKNHVKVWAADDRLWTTQETVEINLQTFARVILKSVSINCDATLLRTCAEWEEQAQKFQAYSASASTAQECRGELRAKGDVLWYCAGQLRKLIGAKAEGKDK